MKAISIRQPFASLIAEGLKDIENRTWSTSYRGPILIHASAQIARGACEWLEDAHGIAVDVSHLKFGGIVGKAILVDCVERHESEWFTGPYGFVLEKAKVVPFKPMKGWLNIYDVDI